VFSSGTVSLRSIFVMLGSLVMFVSSHFYPHRLSTPSLRLQTSTFANCS
jgi:hypothetical protein